MVWSGRVWVHTEFGTKLSQHYAQHPDTNKYYAVDFNFNSLIWGTVTFLGDKGYQLTTPAPIILGLRIYDKECNIPCSDWELIDSAKSDLDDTPKIHSDIKESVGSPRCKNKDLAEESELQKIAEAIPTP